MLTLRVGLPPNSCFSTPNFFDKLTNIRLFLFDQKFTTAIYQIRAASTWVLMSPAIQMAGAKLSSGSVNNTFILRAFCGFAATTKSLRISSPFFLVALPASPFAWSTKRKTNSEANPGVAYSFSFQQSNSLRHFFRTARPPRSRLQQWLKEHKYITPSLDALDRPLQKYSGWFLRKKHLWAVLEDGLVITVQFIFKICKLF